MGMRIYGERKTQIPLSSTATIDPLARDPAQAGSILIQKLPTIPTLMT